MSNDIYNNIFRIIKEDIILFAKRFLFLFMLIGPVFLTIFTNIPYFLGLYVFSFAIWWGMRIRRRVNRKHAGGIGTV